MLDNLIFLKSNKIRSIYEQGISFLILLAVSFRVHAIFFIVVAVYMAGFEIFKHITGTSHAVSIVNWLWHFIGGFFVPVAFATVLAARFVYMVIYIRPKEPTRYLINDVRRILLSPQRLANGIPVLIALAVLVDIFCFIKNNITIANPFSWDKTFMELDLILHFCHNPWQLLQPILAHRAVTFGLNIAYNLWFPILWGTTLWVIFSKENSVLRLQYLLAFFLCWTVGGSLLAITFSSAGPVYYGHVVNGPNPFAQLIDYLHDTDKYIELWAVSTQDMLWRNYVTKRSMIGLGISAMPSMHNATTMLLAILASHCGRKAVIAGGVYALAIFLGSIHLGWHYAVDCYAGIALAIFFWWISGHIIRWYIRFPFVPNF